MNDQIKQIADRLKGLRDVLDISIDDAASTCGLTTEQYNDYETGNTDIPVSVLHNMAQKYAIDLTVLLTGQEPHLHRYSLTRKNAGVGVERCKAYCYEALAYSFINRKAEPFLVTVEPKPDDFNTPLNAHTGQEFTYILEGKLKINLAGKEMILEEGDSLYFDSTLPHAMTALDNKTCKFLAVIS